MSGPCPSKVLLASSILYQKWRKFAKLSKKVLISGLLRHLLILSKYSKTSQRIFFHEIEQFWGVCDVKLRHWFFLGHPNIYTYDMSVKHRMTCFQCGPGLAGWRRWEMEWNHIVKKNKLCSNKYVIIQVGVTRFTH